MKAIEVFINALAGGSAPEGLAPPSTMRQLSKMAPTPLARQKSGPGKGPYLSCAAQLLLDLNKADGGAGSKMDRSLCTARDAALADFNFDTSRINLMGSISRL
jgi:hypothetical protein